MNPVIKNKWLTGLLIVLLAANAVTIALFWLNKPKPATGPKGSPAEFLVKELSLDARQQEQLKVLVTEHRKNAEELRMKIRTAKESFFDLLKQSQVADSTKTQAAKAVSVITEQLDLLTLNHFQQVRALCTPEQQKKFDGIIHEVTAMIGQPAPPMHPSGPGGERPPPPGNQPPPGQ